MRHTSRRRGQRGVTLVELSISMGIATVLSLGFLTTMNQISRVQVQERRITFYSSEVREVVHQIARDLRATGSNPRAKPFLFDGDPTTDVPLLLDPNGDGDVSNDIQVSFDRYSADSNEPDGDADDPREAIRYVYDAEQNRITRSVRETSTQWSDEIILVNVCEFAFGFLDRKKQPTTDRDAVSWVLLDALTSSSLDDCNAPNALSRRWALRIKLRNR